MPGQVSIETETRVVALLARGDTIAQIIAEVGCNPKTVTNIKKRNKHNLLTISQRMMEQAEADAASIKNKANSIIAKKLQRTDIDEELVEKAKQDYMDGTITLKELSSFIKEFNKLSVTELVSVSKEMHNQSTGPDKPATPAADMAHLIEAIRSGDEVKVVQATFNAQSEPSSE